ncbi:hypothetical protein GYMLUDRAFT_65009 [Collybiopsis luxurians FD-317 M1]|uniref:Unplaced genomic scaffold GYMLUscaffold_125, whole genome shotgun sequence n=1 Tax=Collybiopsis luxurians FD-317 M1 TaxID=944289 RepID=A0A0D0BNK4_9AGAR|nr:hypothetical protein GYMLUDRAFT_65009 [Collybiopsis luxurians FD-317 M1]
MWEQQGYIGITNANLLQPLAALLKRHKAELILQYVDKDHPQYKAAGKALEIARRAPNKETPDEVDLSIEQEWRIQGAQVLKMSQKLLYQGIQSLTFPTRKKANDTELTPCHSKAYEKNIDAICTSIRQFLNKEVSTKEMWIRGTKSQTATKEQNVWTWKAIHNTFWIGRRWLHCEGYKGRATCQNCGAIEDMEHILVKCDRPGQAEVWNLARQLLAHKQIVLPKEMTMGLVLGCALMHPRDGQGKEIPRAQRLLEITVREATALIWHMRNVHVIQHDNDREKIPLMNEIQNQFYFRLNRRMQLDVTLMNKAKFG